MLKSENSEDRASTKLNQGLAWARAGRCHPLAESDAGESTQPTSGGMAATNRLAILLPDRHRRTLSRQIVATD
jgi:hypothetical protein